MRKIAAVLLRRSIDFEVRNEKDFLWPKAAPDVKLLIKTGMLQAMAKTETQLCKAIGNICASLACYICDPAESPEGWNDLLPCLMGMWAIPGPNAARQRETAINVLAQVVLPMKDTIRAQQGQLAGLLQAGFADQDAMVRASTVNLVCEMVEAWDKEEWTPLQPVLPVMLECIKSCGQDENALKCILEALVSTADEEPNFFKPRMGDFIKFFQALAVDKNIDETHRVIGLEWMIAVAEGKKKTLIKWVPNVCEDIIGTCMEMMMECDDDDDWLSRLYDEEGDDDDTAFAAGEQNVDHLVDALGIELTKAALFKKIGEYVGRPNWQAKHAAMVAIKQTVEYIDEEHTTAFAELALQHIGYQDQAAGRIGSARVRHAALEAIGQLAIDQVPHFQEGMYPTVIPALLGRFDDPEERVSAMALSAFVNFGDEVDDTVMAEHSGVLMGKLKEKLQCQHRGIRQETLTCIAVIASCLEEQFAQYYDDIMPTVKWCVQNCKDDKERMLRGKAFECMSLLGLAVGRKKFAPDVMQAMTEMASMPMKADDVQKDYIKEAMERIAKTLKEEFATFLPQLLPQIVGELALPNPTVEANAIDDTDDEEEEDMLSVRTIDGKKVSIKSSRFTDMKNAVELLLAVVQETGKAFGPFVVDTAKALVPLLETTDQMSYLCHELRSEAFSVWGELIKTAAKLPNGEQTSRELLVTFLDKVIAGSEKEEDAETITEVARGIQKALENAPKGSLTDVQFNKVKDFLIKKLQEAFELRDKQGLETDSEDEDAVANADREEEREDEETRRIALAAVFGSLMSANTNAFMGICDSIIIPLMQKWLQSSNHEDLILAFNLISDIFEHLKGQSQALWPMFIQQLGTGLTHKEPDVRVAASYATNLAMRVPEFATFQNGEVAKQMFEILATVVVKSPKPKNKDTNGKLAYDNAIAALTVACIHCPHLAPEGNVDRLWDEAIFQRLPIRYDEDESQKLNEYLFDKVSAQDPNTLGANSCRLPKLLGLFSDIYSTNFIFYNFYFYLI